MIPISVENFLQKKKGDIFRKNITSAATVLHRLGISESSQFGEFYMKYQGAFVSPKDEPELLDIDDVAIPAIPDQTEYIKDVHGIPDNYLALTTDESEGMYLYDKNNGTVFDVNFEDIPLLINGSLSETWSDFNSFLTWYFS
ncbi:SMI1/KNR4 family protein [Chromobacterium violaceum]|uniref:SMI1/KNR4 family protein n=1 Tax=Chromobacterium violaceum TaxID=536 RepID=UPI001B33E8EB|nr:SMI1/KNR4 family protein [Chromobacterium violaceum]MBP4047413.1 SMI1/KNR4 family protein [Chromobacterium violaceum]